MTERDQTRRFEEQVLPHLDAAYNLARWLCGSASEAEDVVQDACLRAFRFFDGFRGDNARAWLLAIVRNTWFTQWRQRQAEARDASYDDAMGGHAPLPGWFDPAGSDPEGLAIRREDAHRVQRALGELPVQFREVLVLRELQDMSYADIAAVAGIPVGTVMSRLSRGRRLLGAALRGGADGAAPPRPGAGSVADARRAGMPQAGQGAGE